MSDEDFIRVDVWLDQRSQETLEFLRTKYGASKSGALRAGLEMVRKQLGLDNPPNVSKSTE